MHRIDDTTATGAAHDAGPEGTLLGRAMTANAVFSATSGAVLALASTGLDGWLGVNRWVLVALGVGLVLFGADLWVSARRRHRIRLSGIVAVAGDVAWVLAAVVLVGFTDVLTDAGNVALSAVSVVVLAFAVAQTVGLRRLAR